jgi:dTDP-4-dehydrorhamnose 3,5-epimerase-like enzyme
MKSKLIKLKVNSDSKGNLISLENGLNIPFEIKRIFYIYGTNDDSIRGNHANKESEFFMICLTGSCKIKIYDQTGNSLVYILDSPDKGLFVPKYIWKEMYDFQENTILLVLSNKKYSPDEYLRNFDEFIKKS